MATTTEYGTETQAQVRLPIGLIASLAALAGALILLFTMGGEQSWPETVTSRFPFAEWVNQAQTWLEDNFKWLTRAVGKVVVDLMETVELFLWTAPWLVVVALFTIPALAYGGLRLALVALACIWIWGAFDMWDEAMSTLALMSVSVTLSVLIGVGLGVVSAWSNRFDAFLRPILDTMQVMPAFVYLLPAIFFFGIGYAAAVMAVMIYALPPVIRLTSLGIRQVPATMIEAAESFGTTQRQLLFKVQIPQAMPSILLGINQTIMMALALAVFAVFVGAGGLGEEVWNAIRRLKVGWSLEGGLCIVTMAILFDRLSQKIATPDRPAKSAIGAPPFRLLPQSWEVWGAARGTEAVIAVIWQILAAPMRGVARLADLIGARTGEWVRRHSFLIAGIILIGAMLAIEIYAPRGWRIGGFPSALEFSIRAPVDDAIDWLTVNPTFILITQAIRSGVFLYFLDPLDRFLTETPWWYMTAAFTGLIWLAAGWRLGIVTLLSLAFCGAAGLWALTMYTLAGTTVSVLICLVLGIPIGIWAAYSRTADQIIRPILDLMQTIPSFVYLIPALFFFGGNPTTAVIATVVYAIPPIIRTTTLGLRQVPAEIGEVATAFGTRPLQALTKVRLPLASPSILLGVNQTVIMALAMQTVTPLVAGLGLGKEVYDAMNTVNTGKGLAAGIGIVLMAVILDRLTQAVTATQRRALGLK